MDYLSPAAFAAPLPPMSSQPERVDFEMPSSETPPRERKPAHFVVHGRSLEYVKRQCLSFVTTKRAIHRSYSPSFLDVKIYGDAYQPVEMRVFVEEGGEKGLVVVEVLRLRADRCAFSELFCELRQGFISAGANVAYPGSAVAALSTPASQHSQFRTSVLSAPPAAAVAAAAQIQSYFVVPSDPERRAEYLAPIVAMLNSVWTRTQAEGCRIVAVMTKMFHNADVVAKDLLDIVLPMKDSPDEDTAFFVRAIMQNVQLHKFATLHLKESRWQAEAVSESERG